MESTRSQNRMITSWIVKWSVTIVVQIENFVIKQIDSSITKKGPKTKIVPIKLVEFSWTKKDISIVTTINVVSFPVTIKSFIRSFVTVTKFVSVLRLTKKSSVKFGNKSLFNPPFKTTQTTTKIGLLGWEIWVGKRSFTINTKLQFSSIES